MAIRKAADKTADKKAKTTYIVISDETGREIGPFDSRALAEAEAARHDHGGAAHVEEREA